MFTGDGPLLDTDLLTLLVTTVVFLSGFSSLRLHATLGTKRKVLDDVVSSVTTTAGYADRLRWLEFAVSNAASSEEWKEAAAQLRSEDDPALSDRDLRTAQPRFPPLSSPWRIDELDEVMAATLGLVLLVLTALGMIFVGAVVSGTASGRWAAAIAFAAAALVVSVTLLDVRSVAGEYHQLAEVLALQGPTVTEWRPQGDVDEGKEVRSSPTGDRAFSEIPWSTRAALIERPEDTVRTGTDVDQQRLSRATVIIPEWSTPHALAALARRQQIVETPRSAPATGVSRSMIEGLAYAQRAVLLNPLDPACRVVLGALLADQLAVDLEEALRNGDGSSLLQALPLSDVLSRDSEADRSRPARWRFSLVLRRAREASILVERRWGAVEGRRSAVGRLTQLDRIAVDYLLGRAYLLSACHDPRSGLSRANVRSALKHLDLAERGRAEAAQLDSSASTASLLSWQHLGFSPWPLCDDLPEVRAWWLDAARRVESGRFESTGAFANLWAAGPTPGGGGAGGSP